MGTMIQLAGLDEAGFRGERFQDHPRPLCGNNEVLCLTRPELVLGIHRRYLHAGADIIETNTFGATAVSQADYGLETLSYELNREAARLARQAVDEIVSSEPSGRRRFVAGLLGPTNRTLSISPDVNDPGARAIEYDTLEQAYLEAARGLVDGGVDMLLIETIFDTLNAKAAIRAIKLLCAERMSDIPVMLSGTIPDRSGRTLSGQTPTAMLSSLTHADPLSVGLNCALGARALKPFLEELARHAPCAVSAHPNAGLPNAFGEYDESPESMAEAIQEYAREGLVNIVGGCCGTTPEHIAAIAEAVAPFPPRTPPSSPRRTLLSGLEALAIEPDSGFVPVGERTNVSGSRRFARLIRDENYDEALEIAARQVRDGARVIDVNVDDAMIDGAAAMRRFLNLAAAEPDIARVPIMLDSSNWETVQAGLKCLQGRGIVNSISLKEGPERLLHRAREIHSFGAVMVVMAFDEKGQADTLRRRLEILRRAASLLIEKGPIEPECIVFDPNVFAVGTGIEQHRRYALDFFETVRTLRREFPRCPVIGGISNVSFAFKGNDTVRRAINALFLHRAIDAGLSMGIVDPAHIDDSNEIDEDLRELVDDLLLDRRDDATEHLVGYAGSAGDAAKPEGGEQRQWRSAPLTERIVYAFVNGTAEAIEADTLEALEETGDPLRVIEGPLMSGMNEVGRRFGAGGMFLPQVVKSARVMNKAVSVLRPYLDAAGGGKRRPGARVLLATVKGDVHDIGKSIVGVILGCNNYDVKDLGVMVPAEDIREAARREHPDIIGLSGLITPSLREMEQVADALQRAGITVPLLIGGATTSPVHTAVKIAPHYDGPVVHVKDASLVPGVCATLVDPRAREGFLRDLARSQNEARRGHSRRDRSKGVVSLGRAREAALRIDWREQPPALPRMPGVHRLDTIAADDIFALIDWREFFKAWGIGGAYPSVLDDPQTGPEARRLLGDARRMLETIRERAHPPARGIVGIFPANSVAGDDIAVFENSSREKLRCTVHTLRRQHPSPCDGSCPALADFIAPRESGIEDCLGFFAVTAGEITRTVAEPYKRDSDDYRALLAGMLADRLAEACAEKAHELVRKRYWGYAPDEHLSAGDLLAEKYCGIRPAPGYPACPDHSEKFTLFKLLNVTDELGIELTETAAMNPPSSVCGYYFAHPRARYFAVGKIREDQLQNYSRRKGWNRETAKKWLAEAAG